MSALHEFIPYTYTPVELPENLTAVRNVIFGVNPTISDLDYRAGQLLSIIHGCYDEYLTTLDTRLTYTPFKMNPPHAEVKLPDLASIPDKVDLDSLNPILDDFKLLIKSQLFVDRIVGITLALIYKTEELRNEMEKRKILGLD
jgi:hypothetical protein